MKVMWKACVAIALTGLGLVAAGPVQSQGTASQAPPITVSIEIALGPGGSPREIRKSAAAIIPVAILFLGLSNQMSVAVICFGAIWPVLLSSVYGFGSVQGRLQEVSAVLGLSRAEFLRKIAFPSATPDILAGVRISLAVSLILAVVTEMQASLPGIGRDIFLAQRNFRSPDLYGGLILLGLIGFGANHALLAFEKRALRWRNSYS